MPIYNHVYMFVPIWAGMRLNSRIEFSYKIYNFIYSILSSFPRILLATDRNQTKFLSE